MVSIVKSVSLPVELLKKVETIPNFSRWVASRLRVYGEDEDILTMRSEALERKVEHLEQRIRETFEDMPSGSRMKERFIDRFWDVVE